MAVAPVLEALVQPVRRVVADKIVTHWIQSMHHKRSASNRTPDASVTVEAGDIIQGPASTAFARGCSVRDEENELPVDRLCQDG